MRRKLRPAASLVEVLVVIAITGVLISLLLAAVQRVREAANRTECQNRLKQIGLAAHNYHGVHHAFPPGVSYENGRSPQPHLTWCARLLPFLDQEAAWKEAVEAFTKDRFFRNDPPHTGVSRVVPGFTCPSDGRTRQPAELAGPIRVGLLSFMGVEGIDQTTKDGTLFLDSRVRLSDVLDGASNTLFVGERPPSADQNLGWWYGGWGQDQDGSCDSVLGAREQIVKPKLWECPDPSFRRGNVQDDCDALHFWSLHPGGAHFLFCDGSVRFLRYEADAVLPALATRAGGEVVDSTN